MFFNVIQSYFVVRLHLGFSNYRHPRSPCKIYYGVFHVIHLATCPCFFVVFA